MHCVTCKILRVWYVELVALDRDYVTELQISLAVPKVTFMEVKLIIVWPFWQVKGILWDASANNILFFEAGSAEIFIKPFFVWSSIVSTETRTAGQVFYLVLSQLVRFSVLKSYRASKPVQPRLSAAPVAANWTNCIVIMSNGNRAHKVVTLECEYMFDKHEGHSVTMWKVKLLWVHLRTYHWLLWLF